MKRLFLSFSVTGDPPGRQFVRLLLARLGQQSIEPWVYELPGGQVRSGNSITAACRAQIEKADLFAVYVTDRAIESDFVDMEVAHALWVSTQRPLPVVPLLATTIPRRRWPPALDQITGYKGQMLLEPHVDAVETIVLDICTQLGVDYVPPRPVTPRLPLTQRVIDEVKTHMSTSGFDMSDFDRLRKRCDAAVDAFNAGELERTRKLVDSILIDLELEFGLAKPYYPRIVHHSALLAEAYAGSGSFEDVERKFSALIDEAGPLLDANAYAGRGNARLARGKFKEALGDYVAAERHLDCPDPALFYNIVRARTLGGLSIERAEIDRRRAEVDAGMATRQPGDLSRLCSVLALGYAYMGDSKAALGQWQDIADLSDVFPEVVLEICQNLHQQAADRYGRSGATSATAQAVLGSYLAAQSEPDKAALVPLHHFEARMAYEAGDVGRSRRLIEPLIRRFPRSPIITVDGALFALTERDVSQARTLCRQVADLADHTICQPGISLQEFHYAQGQAFWLLGRGPEARESFRRSGYPPTHAYEAVLSSQLGALK